MPTSTQAIRLTPIRCRRCGDLVHLTVTVDTAETPDLEVMGEHFHSLSNAADALDGHRFVGRMQHGDDGRPRRFALVLVSCPGPKGRAFGRRR